MKTGISVSDPGYLPSAEQGTGCAVPAVKQRAISSLSTPQYAVGGVVVLGPPREVDDCQPTKSVLLWRERAQRNSMYKNTNACHAKAKNRLAV